MAARLRYLRNLGAGPDIAVTSAVLAIQSCDSAVHVPARQSWWAGTQALKRTAE
jgi:hypothetical protein